VDDETTTTEPTVAVGEPPIPCQEDEACWDCSTMGNLVCGPTATRVSTETPAVNLGRCIDGTSEFGFILCTGDEIAVPVAPHPTMNPPDDDMLKSSLPETGSTSTPVVSIALVLTILGASLLRLARR
jgi:LPXTG-motif cell wall-anchored protein